MVVSRPETPPLVAGSLESRSSTAFKVIAVVAFLGLIVALVPGGPPGASLAAAVAGLASGVSAVLYAAVALGIDRRRPWGLGALRPLLIVTAVASSYAAVAAQVDGRVRLPFELVLVVWAWLGVRDPSAISPLGRLSISVVAVAAVALAAGLFSRQLFGWGGSFDVRESDIHAALQADCRAGSSELPGSFNVTYEWSWRSWRPFQSGLDVVVIGWTGDDELGRPLYVLGDTPAGASGIYFGRQDIPSLSLARQVEAESAASVHWGVELSEQNLSSGRLDLQLVRARAEPPAPEPLSITATYVHVGAWRASTTVACSW